MNTAEFTNLFSNVFLLVCILASYAGLFLMFREMGRSGWLSLIPFYNQYVLFDEVYGNGWRFLLLLIPLVNIYVLIKLVIDWVKDYGLTAGFLLCAISNVLFVLFSA